MSSTVREMRRDSQSAYGGKLDALLNGLGALADWLGQPSRPSKVRVPDFLDMNVSETFLLALRAGVRTEVVRVTERPAPTDGIVLRQEPPAGTKVRRDAKVTLTVRHPPRA